MSDINKESLIKRYTEKASEAVTLIETGNANNRPREDMVRMIACVLTLAYCDGRADGLDIGQKIIAGIRTGAST